MIFTTTASFTRPANTTAYAAGDHVSTTAGAALDFALLQSHEGAGRIESVLLRKSTTTTTAASFTLHIYATTDNLTVAADNAAQTLADDDWLGAVALDLSSGAQALSTGLAERIALSAPIYFNRGVATRSIYGILVATGTYTPGSAEVFQIELGIES